MPVGHAGDRRNLGGVVRGEPGRGAPASVTSTPASTSPTATSCRTSTWRVVRLPLCGHADRQPGRAGDERRLLEQGRAAGPGRSRHAHRGHHRRADQRHGVAGVAPEAKIVVLKAGTEQGYFFTQSVVDALRYAGDQHLDVVNMSFFADPWLFNCRNDKEQKAIIKAISAAARYAQQRGVVLVAAAGNEGIDLNHPVADEISPDFPPGAAVTRPVNNSCVVLPKEIAWRRRRYRDRRGEPAGVVLDATGISPTSPRRAARGSRPRRSIPPGGGCCRRTPPTAARPRPRGRARAPRPGRQRQLLRLVERDVDGRAARRRRRGADPGRASGDAARRGRGAAAQHRDRPAVPGGARSWCRVLRCPGAVLQRAARGTTTSTARGS